MSLPICGNCRSSYAQWPHSSYCELCSIQAPNTICPACSSHVSANVCLCAFPPPTFCSDCSAKHRISEEHLIQPISILRILKTREQYEGHKVRIDRIDFVQGKLNMWCKGSVERAKEELKTTVKKLHSQLNAQFANMMNQLEAASEKITRICQCLESMKGDYSLQSGTFLDGVANEKVEEAQLRILETLFTYTANNVDPALSIFGSVFSLVDNIPDISPSRICAGDLSPQHPEAFRDSEQLPPPTLLEVESVVLEHQEGWHSRGKTLEQAICSICEVHFLLPSKSQVEADGRYYCSETCKKKYELYYCYTCKGQITDNSWWSTAQQHYPEYADYFQRFCSLICLTSAIRQVQQSQCIWCHASPSLSAKGEIHAIRLGCDHFFHDVECLIKYLSGMSEHFAKKVEYKCPGCYTKLPAEVVEFALKVVQQQSSGDMLPCQKCGNQQAKFTFKCKHVLCRSCLKWKKKLFGLGIGESVCSICN